MDNKKEIDVMMIVAMIDRRIEELDAVAYKTTGIYDKIGELVMLKRRIEGFESE